VWFADGDELGVVDGDHVAETSGAKIGAHAKLSTSPSGDVWVLSEGTLDRFARDDRDPGASTLGSTWASVIGPIFARSCSACHLPDGISGTDLSTASAWEGERPEIHERIVVKRSMPPAGHPLSDEDRAVIQRWLEGADTGGAPATR
jgi:mono/diheme cytochrome c family protein